ncbi:MAG: type II secretory pathway pseudopilin PulG [Psychromonas sp.]|jgi:type II secretory pathway pseudopilin PulG
MEGFLMFKNTAQNGFLLVEILVSLLIISLTAVNITGLQKLIVEQNRNNVAHTEVIALANQKVNQLLSYDNVARLDALVGINLPTETPGLTTFNLEWAVSSDLAESASMRTVTLQIKWEDSKGDELVYTYSEKINVTPSRAIIESVLETNDVIYFNPKKRYKNKDFVIYNSELFEAKRNVSATPETTSGDWESYGLINNKDLENDQNLAALF